MPEGHTVHRTANKFAKLFANKQLEVSSPQGRFTDSRLVSGQQLVSADAIGKQMTIMGQTIGEWGAIIKDELFLPPALLIGFAKGVVFLPDVQNLSFQLRKSDIRLDSFHSLLPYSPV